MIASYGEITEPTIRAFVDGFYARGRRDPMPGPIFTNAIAEGAWPVHPGKMYACWPPVLLIRGRYKGNPVSTRRKIASVVPPLFGNWLDLCEATAAEIFIPEIADRFMCAARHIAESLKLALFFRPNWAWSEDLRRHPKVAGTCA